jgi:putative phosphoribosyl transferase
MFESRMDAGEQLAVVLDQHDVELGADLVLAVSLSGVPVAKAVADRLGLPLDIIVARALCAPDDPTVTVGAIVADGTTWYDEAAFGPPGRSRDALEPARQHALTRTRTRLVQVRGDTRLRLLRGSTVVLVADGLEDEAVLRACIRSVRRAGVEGVVVAVPVADPVAAERIATYADEVVCVATPPHFERVEQFYDAFEPVSVDEARGYLSDDVVNVV